MNKLTSVEQTLANGRVLRIVTSNVRPPIPDRSYDWNAIDDRTYDGNGPIGHGATAEAAVRDLVDQICEREDICPPDCWCCAQEKTNAQ